MRIFIIGYVITDFMKLCIEIILTIKNSIVKFFEERY